MNWWDKKKGFNTILSSLPPSIPLPLTSSAWAEILYNDLVKLMEGGPEGGRGVQLVDLRGRDELRKDGKLPGALCLPGEKGVICSKWYIYIYIYKKH